MLPRLAYSALSSRIWTPPPAQTGPPSVVSTGECDPELHGFAPQALTCINTAFTVLSRERRGIRGLSLVKETMSIAALNACLAVDPAWIRNTRRQSSFTTLLGMAHSLELLWTDSIRCDMGTQGFLRSIQTLHSTSKQRMSSLAIAINKGSEVALVLCLRTPGSGPGASFIVLDCQQRSGHRGPSFLLFNDLQQCASFLSTLLSGPSTRDNVCTAYCLAVAPDTLDLAQGANTAMQFALPARMAPPSPAAFPHAHLQAPRAFQCAICMDECPGSVMRHLHGCEHMFCRGCLGHFISGKLVERRYPIFCPVCVTMPRMGKPGVVTEDVLSRAGISEDLMAVWTELQMSQVSILVHCRWCKRSAYVDKSDYEHTDTVTCPLPDCSHVWCKRCTQTVHPYRPHTCDGVAELETLMQDRGWKFCPGCKTPTEKVAGCNHMTCAAPGCNSHFCYICGKLIIRSALPSDIRPALEAHYRRCRLFDR